MRFDGSIFVALLLLHFPVYILQSSFHALGWFGNLAQGLAILMGAVHFGRVALAPASKTPPELMLIFLGLSIWLMAHTLLAYSELLLGMPATGTVTDVIWMVGYFVLLRALHHLLKKTDGTSAAIKQQVIIVFSAVMIVIAVLAPLLQETDRKLSLKIIQVIFPVMDLWMAAMAFRVARHEGMRKWLIVAFGSLIIGIADLIFPYHDAIAEPVYRYLDIPLFAGYSSWWLLGALLARESRERRLQSA